MKDKVDEIPDVLRILRSEADCFQKTLNSPFLPILICRFNNSVCVGDNQVSSLKPDDFFFIHRIREHPDRSAARLEPFHRPIASENHGWIVSCIDVSEGSFPVVDDA